MAVKVEVWGEYALFARPEFKVERVSYGVPTPSACRGIRESIYWHPGIRWRIDRIYVCNPVRFTSIRRNELRDKISARVVQTAMNNGGEIGLSASDLIQQRTTVLLRNVHYVIEAHFDLTERAAPGDNSGKFQDIIRRRLAKGQCFQRPYFGAREFPAEFRAWPGGEIPAIPNTRDLGLMLYDMNYDDPQNIHPSFFRAQIKDGVIEVPAAGSEAVLE